MQDKTGYLNYIEICIRYPQVIARDWTEEMLQTFAKAGLLTKIQIDLQAYYAEADLVQLLEIQLGDADTHK